MDKAVQQRAKKTSVSTITDREREGREEQVKYHKIEGRNEQRGSIQYFNKGKNNLSREKSASRSSKSIPRSAAKTSTQKKREYAKVGTIPGVHRAAINSIVPLESYQDSKGVCYFGSDDYTVSRVEFDLQSLGQLGNPVTIVKPYRHRGQVTDMALGSQNRYLLSCGKDSYLKLGVLAEDQDESASKCTIF